MSIYTEILERAILPAGDRLAGTSVMHHLARWRRLQWADPETLRREQAERLGRLLDHARRHVPYYRTVDPVSNADPFATLRHFPVLHKATIKERPDDFLTSDSAGLIASSSSGSSGIQGTVYHDRYEQSAAMAIQMLWMTWSGWQTGETVFQTGMTPDRGAVKRAKDILLRTRYVNAFRSGESEILGHLRELEQRPRRLLCGYASSLHLYASLALEHDLRIPFRYAVSWGDKLFPHYRVAIEQAFGARVHDTYGCTEGLMIAAQCEHLGYHIMTPHIVLELLDDDGREVEPGQMGRVVATSLDAYRMPLIRYALGDLAARRPETEGCPCGRHLPLLDRVVGRDTDVVRTPGGRFLIVHFFTGIFEFVPEIRQFQVIQDDPDGITIHYIPDHGFSPEVLERLRNRIAAELDSEPFTVRFEHIQQIPPSPSGKPQIVLSRLGLAGRNAAPR